MRDGPLDKRGGIGVGFGVIFGWVTDAEEVAVDHVNDVAARFVGIALGKELGLDVGSFGPLPEEFFKGLRIFCFFQGKTLLFELDATGDEVTAAQGYEVGEELADLAQFGFRIFGEGGSVSGRGKAEG